MKADIVADGTGPLLDREEPVSLMEPLLISEGSRFRGELTDLAVDLAARSAGFRRSLPEGIVAALADLVRSMNCYYSNLIEGHDTHPVDIERALKNDYSADLRKKNLQLEAKAHIEVQRWIDGGGLHGRATKRAGLCEVHRRFGQMLPEELSWVENPESGERIRMVPGGLRNYAHRVKTDAILAAAAAHHRLLWIHPFLDGNGRVARLMSHAMLLEALDTGAIWSVARGLARKVADYKRGLAECDFPRRNDLDGRGYLSEEALARFTSFFLGICLDQVTFMEGLVEPEHLRTRIMMWAEEEVRLNALPSRAGSVLEALLYRGQLPRGEVGQVLRITDRHARRIVAALMARNVLVSDSSRAPLRLAFPAALAPRWMPGLFPDTKQG